MAKHKFKTYKAYACSKDILYHVPDDCGGIQVYFTEEDLRENKKCISDGKYGCKVCEFTIKIPTEVEDGI